MRVHKAKSPSIEPAMDKPLNKQVPFPSHIFLSQKSYKLLPSKKPAIPMNQPNKET